MERPWPLTGRDAELRAIAAAVRPGAAGILVAGPAGVGKTRLAREALAHAAERGSRVVWAHGSSAARPFPLGAFAGLLDAVPVDPAHVVTRALADLGEAGPFVLAVDDAHLLDELSAILVQRLVVRRLAPVVVTLRVGEPAPDPVTSLWKDGHLARLALAPLDAATPTALVAEALAGPVESSSARRLWTLTQGSPLFLRHLLLGEVQAGRFTPASGIWRWTGDPGISPELATILEREIGRLDPEVQDVVDLVALAEPVAVPTLGELSARDAVETAEARGLVRIDPVGDGLVARLAHPLYGEVRRATMGHLRARRLRGLVAATVDGAADPIPRAVLMLDSDLDPDPALFLRAAEAAIGFYDLPLAERLARAAAARGDWYARTVHASALSWLSRGEEAEAILRELADTAPNSSLRAVALLHRVGNLLWTMARPDEARTVLAAAEATGSARLHVAAMSVAVAASRGDIPDVQARGPALLEGELPDNLARLLVASAVSAVAAVTGRLEPLERGALVGGLTARRAPAGIPGFGLADWQVLGHRLAGQPHQAVGVARRMQDASADLPGPALLGLVLAGHAALAGGRVREALTLLREAWAGLMSSGHEFRFRCRTLLATAYALAGNAEAARPLVTGLTENQHPAYQLFAPDDLLAGAWGAAAEGASSAAVRLAGAAAELARVQDSPAYEVLAWQTVVQLGGHPPAARLQELSVDGPRAQATRAYARAWADQDGAGLLEASGVWERVGDLVAAGDAAGQAADVHRQHGRQGSALSAAARAQRLAQLSGARTPALTTAAQPLPLTAREREIAVLAAQGLSNREIAERLTVSVRTVEGHLYRAGHKLGISDRAALAKILAPGESE